APNGDAHRTPDKRKIVIRHNNAARRSTASLRPHPGMTRRECADNECLRRSFTPHDPSGQQQTTGLSLSYPESAGCFPNSSQTLNARSSARPSQRVDYRSDICDIITGRAWDSENRKASSTTERRSRIFSKPTSAFSAAKAAEFEPT